MSHEPEQPSTPGETPETGIFESDPNADSAEGLAGGMGVSSERSGEVRGGDEDATYGAMETHPDEDLDSGRPEQSPAGPEVHPDAPPTKDHRGRLHGDHNRPNEDDPKG